MATDNSNSSEPLVVSPAEPLVVSPAEPRYVKIIKICALYVFPAIIFALLMAILFIPAPKKDLPKSPKDIDAEIERLLQEKQNLSEQL